MAGVAERITIDPEQCGGRPYTGGMRIRMSEMLELWAAGLSSEQVLEELSDREGEDIRIVSTLSDPS